MAVKQISTRMLQTVGRAAQQRQLSTTHNLRVWEVNQPWAPALKGGYAVLVLLLEL
jgi:hypothetical protein